MVLLVFHMIMKRTVNDVNVTWKAQPPDIYTPDAVHTYCVHESIAYITKRCTMPRSRPGIGNKQNNWGGFDWYIQWINILASSYTTITIKKLSIWAERAIFTMKWRILLINVTYKEVKIEISAHSAVLH